MISLPEFKTAIAALLLLAMASTIRGQVSFPDTANNVSYASVTELNYTDANYTLSYDTGEFQYGRLWLPARQSNPNLLIFIHGGCWLNQFDMAHTYPLLTALSQVGYAVWSMEYRRVGDAGGGWPGTYDDIKTGIAFAQNLGNYGVNVDNTVIVGHSAGGHLALLAGIDFPDVRGVIGLAAITNIVEYAEGTNSCEIATPSFMGASPRDAPKRYKTANPAELELHENTVLLHGSSDSIVGIRQASLAGASTTRVDGAGHFDWVHPGTESVRLLLSVLKDMF